MQSKSLPEFCFETLSQEVPLQRVAGLDEIEQVQLASGESGGGIKVFTGERVSKVTLVDFKLGDGVPVPHHNDRLCVGAEHPDDVIADLDRALAGVKTSTSVATAAGT